MGCCENTGGCNAVSLSASDYEAAAFGGSFRNLLDLFNRLKGLDLRKLKELFELFDKITNAPTLPDAVRAGLDAFRIIATMTPNETDDKIVAVLDSILTDDVINLLTRIIGGFLGADARAKFNLAAANDFSVTATDRAYLEAKAIPVSFLFRLALELLPLLEQFLNR